MNQIKGLVHAIGETETVSDKFKKRELVINVAGTYPQFISLQLTQDKTSLADKLTIGTEINCHINLRGREWTSPKGEVKYFNTLECWKIDGASVTTAPITEQAKDDLPF